MESDLFPIPEYMERSREFTNAVLGHYRLNGIATFDEFYPKEVRLLS